jgi:hypothetical protein
MSDKQSLSAKKPQKETAALVGLRLSPINHKDFTAC